MPAQKVFHSLFFQISWFFFCWKIFFHVSCCLSTFFSFDAVFLVIFHRSSSSRTSIRSTLHKGGQGERDWNRPNNLPLILNAYYFSEYSQCFIAEFPELPKKYIKYWFILHLLNECVIVKVSNFAKSPCSNFVRWRLIS